MVQSRNEFVNEAIPVSDFFKTLATNYYWSNEYERKQKMDVKESVAKESKIDVENKKIWGLDLSEINGRVEDNVDKIAQHIIYSIVSQAVKHKSALVQFYRTRNDDEQQCKQEAYRNISNAWRDEYCLCSPINQTPKDRMKTAEWRIIMCYYSMYKAVSSIIHTRSAERLGNSHVKTLDIHANEYLQSKARVLYPFPLRFNPRNPNYTSPEIPYPSREVTHKFKSYTRRVDNCMKEQYKALQSLSIWDKSRNIDSFFHVMKLFREWANYGHGGIFSRLYGEGFIRYLDSSLRLLSYSSLALAEVIQILSFGYDSFQREVARYVKSSDMGITDSSKLVEDRFEVYDRALSHI